MIRFHLSSRSNVPPYLQLVEQVRQALLSGVLRPGDRLPTVKEVVGSLAINPNTVLKAYRDLEREGLVEGRQGVGTFVLRRPDGPPPREQAALERSLSAWVGKARLAGLADGDIESMVRTVLRASDKAATA
ncbi:MAG TPA: GntR family transcriptional regulator [Jatrophihabitans sp.]|nr:GntR family transcriptional regulator [Jatrophihabitans sp.]